MVTEKEWGAAKWVRVFEELDDSELLLAYEICEKILKLRNCYWLLSSCKKEKEYELQKNA